MNMQPAGEGAPIVRVYNHKLSPRTDAGRRESHPWRDISSESVLHVITKHHD